MSKLTLSNGSAAGAGHRGHRRFRGSDLALALWLGAAALGAAGAGYGRLLAGELPRDSRDWIQLKSPNFLLFSDAGERRTREVAADLEQVRATLAQLAPSMVLTAPCPTYVYVFKDRSAFARYPVAIQGKRVEDVRGFFLSRPAANYMVIDADPRADALHYVRHEYLHYLLHNNFSHLPLWLDEGMAEFYGTLYRTGSRVRIGMPIPEHIRWLRDNPPMPLVQLFAIDHDSKDYHEGIRHGTFYAESWALTHYLVFGDPPRRRQLAQMAKLLEAGVPHEKAVAQAFGGDYETLERELRVYVSRNVFPYRELPIPDISETGAAVQPLAAADLLHRLGDLLLAMDRDHPARAVEHFEAALAANPRHGLAMAGLGQIDEQAGRWREAQERYQKAIEAAPAEPLPHFLLGRLQREHPQAGAGGPDPLHAAEAELVRATELAPGFGEGWSALAIAWMRLDPASPQALAAFETAHRLLPQRTDVTLNLAVSYAWNDQRPKAEALIARAAAMTARPQDLENARAALAAADHHRFVAAYNRAIELAKAGKRQEAIEWLDSVLKATTDPADQAAARQLRDRFAAGKASDPR